LPGKQFAGAEHGIGRVVSWSMATVPDAPQGFTNVPLSLEGVKVPVHVVGVQLIR
jgi:hypothetical protein